MTKLKICATLLLTFFLSYTAYTQVRVTTVGIQVKPIIPYNLLNTGKRTIAGNDVNLMINPKLGYAFGMVIRAGLTETISTEFGINYVARNYTLTSRSADNRETSTTMLFDGYEVPFSCLVFIRLGEFTYMNTSAGVSFDFYPTGGIVSNANGYEFAIVESHWAQTSLIANVGFEYRTPKSGYFYVGGSFHRPFAKTADIFLSERIVNTNNYNRLIEDDLSGNYLTIDFRYFFPEKPRNKK